ncbi:SurA N-terminal domain-containing protein [Nitratifractor sp.]
MIEWMQKHNKYLVITIWVATIAFIGAGFVGWGRYKFGIKSNAIAQVGDVGITQSKYDFEYQNLYRELSRIYKGQFDQAKAKKMGLDKEVYHRLVAQAYLLNLADRYGIVVSDEELAHAIMSIRGFQNNGNFDPKIYDAFLENRGLKKPTFEAIFRDDLRVEKLMKLLNLPSVAYEREVLASALSLSDSIRYTVIRPQDVNVTVTDKELHDYWETHKENYKTPKRYRLSVYWVDTSDINVSENDLKDYYERNSFNYVDAQGKTLPFEKVRAQVERDYRIKKGKKKALLEYIAFKKGKRTGETMLVAEGEKFPASLWKEIVQAETGKPLKPRPVGSRYAVIKVLGVQEPTLKPFEAAKDAVRADVLRAKRAQVLQKRAKTLLASKNPLDSEASDLRLSKPTMLPGLKPAQSLQFVQRLFTSNQKEGIISLKGSVVVYRIVKQNLPQGKTAKVDKTIGAVADRLKEREFRGNLLEALSREYPVKSFVKGF